VASGDDADRGTVASEVQGAENPASGEPGSPRGLTAHMWASIGLGTLIGALFTWLFVSRLDLETLRTLPARLDYRFVALATVVYLLEFLFRAVRWQILLAPLKPVSLGRILSVTFIGFMANSLLPARAGELVKPWVGARHFRIPFSSVLVTAVTERVFDLLGLLSLLVIMTISIWAGGSGNASPALVLWLERSGAVLGAIGMAALGALFLLASRETWARSLFHRFSSHLPGPIERTANRVYDGLAAGLAAFHSPRGPLLAAAWSIAVWANGALAIWIMSGAFAFRLPFAGACFVGLWLAIAVSVPQAPGFIGVWQFAVSTTLIAWGAPEGEAQAFAIVFWLLNFGPATAIGLVCVWHQGLSLRKVLVNAPQPDPRPDDGPRHPAVKPQEDRHRP